ncbi:MAG: hypothetical protein FWG74_03870 [Planctomycetes bacterium]|nr:hypothetical protein [Planctomycetota bacterium]
MSGEKGNDPDRESAADAANRAVAPGPDASGGGSAAAVMEQSQAILSPPAAANAAESVNALSAAAPGAVVPETGAMAADAVQKVSTRPLLTPLSLSQTQFPRKRRLAGILWFFLLFLCPVGVVGWYYLELATPMYVSEMQLTVRQSDHVSAKTGDFLLSMLGGGGGMSGSNQDVRLILAYMRSPEVLRDVDEKLGLRRHFSNPDFDFYSRLPAEATRNDFLNYWNWAVSGRVDAESSLLQVKVKAFSPETARDIAEALLERSEDFVNRINERVHSDAVDKSLAELAHAEERVRRASAAMEEFRRRHGIMDLPTAAAMHVGIIDSLETELAKGRAELSAKAPFMAANSSEMRILQARLGALEERLEAERARIAGSERESKEALAALAADYEGRVTEQEFARQQYTSALTVVETARLKAETQAIYLVPVANPGLPDESLYPRRLLFFLAFAAMNFGAYIFLSIVGSAIAEHSRGNL